ncbi:response regulator [Tateyamaria sp. ANG-S1]|uniref:response regulator n=1 Tax=Tateyamaria sp. ANG-S1 TaxID=1577905 RepID=UPI00057FFA40|nr:response regulator [Tateyamaria sp. ANG-S1]KIC48847.1 chemotaxis protein CheY [Tateyamaria sp. ANG-S1]
MALRDQIRIMVVDDMSTSRGLLVQALEALGIRHIFTAPDGASAVGLLAKTPAHLVISDYNMPNMDGLKLLHTLRSGTKTRGIGFILITGRAEHQIIDHGRKLGMNNYLKKPFAATQLRQCIETVVGPL